MKKVTLDYYSDFDLNSRLIAKIIQFKYTNKKDAILKIFENNKSLFVNLVYNIKKGQLRDASELISSYSLASDIPLFENSGMLDILDEIPHYIFCTITRLYRLQNGSHSLGNH